MKNSVLIGGILAVILILSGCVTGGSDSYEYYSWEEVIWAWEEGVYDMDLEQQLSTYWPEAEAHFYLGDEHPDYFGREEIRKYFEELHENWEIGDYELPEWEQVDEPEEGNVVVIRYDHRELGVIEMLWISRRDEMWGIDMQEVFHFEPVPVNSRFISYADWNENGELDISEHDYYIGSLFHLLFFPHEVETPFDEEIDANDDGFIDEREQGLFKNYLFGSALPDFFDLDPDFSLRAADINDNGDLEDDEMDSLYQFLYSYRLDSRDWNIQENPLWRKMDWDQSGEAEEQEQGEYFHMIFSNLLHQPHPEDIIEAALDTSSPRILPDREEERATPLVNRNIAERVRGKRIAVVGIDSMTDKISDDTRRGLVLFVENSFVNTGQVKVVDRSSIEKIIAENKFQASGLTDEETAVEIGKLAGAEIIVTGSISAVGTNFYLQLRLIDVETAEVVASSLGEAKIENEFLNMSNQAVERLF